MIKEKEIIADRWTEYSVDFDEVHATEDLDQWRAILEEQIHKKGNGTVLDIGTGTGFLANMVAELGYESHGIDFSEGMLSYARENSAKRNVTVTYKLGEGERLPYDDNTFDAVVNSRVMWTLLDPVSALTEWKRVLKPGGVLLSFTRLYSDEDWSENIYKENIDERLPLRSGTVEDYLKVIKDAGYKNEEDIALDKSICLKPELKQWHIFKGVK